MSHQDDPFAHAEHTAHAWLRRITDDLATDDRVFAHRVLRAWLHTVRDRLEVDSAAHLSAQLPELLRGMFFEGWVPARVPVPPSSSAFITEFAVEAGVNEDEAVGVIWLVSEAMRDLLAPGQLARTCAVFPARLRDLLLGVSTGPFDEQPTEVG
ncbi:MULTISPECIES: DUF2267 domain-containing protein [Nocardia]|uniref:DUF2267 domain-containing protein n=1 Tax=Nocardia TaxID=1817 RepID=UPI000D6985E7|nr:MULTISPECIES: DUF2267 domain-containing protein [Nocardia]